MDLITLVTRDLKLVFAPSVGGRLLSAATGGTDLLWRNPEIVDDGLQLAVPRDQWPEQTGAMESWVNVGGSKTWPAPQGWGGSDEWAGPPDPVIDSGRWAAVLTGGPDGATVVTMTSEPDQRTGLQISKRFTVPAAGAEFSEAIEFVNTTHRRISWAIWEVAQLDPTWNGAPCGVVEATVTDNAPPEVEIALQGSVGPGGYAAGRWTIPITPAIGKLRFGNSAGSIGYRRPDGAAVELSFDSALGGCAELWVQEPTPEPIKEFQGLHPRHHLLELEVVGPLTELEPGQSTGLCLTWRLTPSGLGDRPARSMGPVH
ncbi:MAG: hypothetical protein QM804_13490 [Propionicimonas sp.]